MKVRLGFAASCRIEEYCKRIVFHSAMASHCILPHEGGALYEAGIVANDVMASLVYSHFFLCDLWLESDLDVHGAEQFCLARDLLLADTDPYALGAAQAHLLVQEISFHAPEVIQNSLQGILRGCRDIVMMRCIAATDNYGDRVIMLRCIAEAYCVADLLPELKAQYLLAHHRYIVRRRCN